LEIVIDENGYAEENRLANDASNGNCNFQG